MNFQQVKHVLSKALGNRDGLYLDTNAWSALAKGHADPASVINWLEQTNSVPVITRFSIGELAKDDRLANNLADLIESLKVVFVDLGTNDLKGQHWHLVPCEKVLSLKPTDTAAKAELVHLLQNNQIRKTMAEIRTDAATWETKFREMIQQKQKWTWDNFDVQLQQFIRDTCTSSCQTVNETGLTNNHIYVGIKLAFGIAYYRYFLNGQPFRSSDYVDYLHTFPVP